VPIPPEALTRLTTPFFNQGAPVVFVAYCCGKLFAGIAPAGRCKQCARAPKNFRAYSPLEAEALREPLEASISS
jgi:hypothetical protein